MKTMIAILAITALTGCQAIKGGQTTLSVGAGLNVQGSDFVENKWSCELEIKHQVHQAWVKYSHNSICDDGTPFNDNPEPWNDSIRVGYDFIIYNGSGEGE